MGEIEAAGLKILNPIVAGSRLHEVINNRAIEGLTRTEPWMLYEVITLADDEGLQNAVLL